MDGFVDSIIDDILKNDEIDDTLLKDIIEASEEEKKNVLETDFDNAYEIIPEYLISVDMLYIPININKIDIKAFIDTGAQKTIMSKAIAEKCGLLHRINPEYKTEFRGVGSAVSLGVIFNLEITIDNFIIHCNVGVLDTHIDLIMGLDTLKNHGMVIDLKNKCIGNTHFSIDFIDQV